MDTKEFVTTADKLWDIVIYAGCVIIVGLVILTLALFGSGDLAAAGVTAASLVVWIVLNRYAVYRDDKRIVERKQAYIEKYCKDVVVNDPELGTLTFQSDLKEGSLNLKDTKLPGFPDGFEVSVDGFTGETYYVVKFIRRAVADREILIDGLCRCVADTYEDEGITEDDEGERISDAYIAQKLSVTSLALYIDDDNRVTEAYLHGSMSIGISDHIDEHGITAEFKPDGTYDFYSG